jgi:hypothetical protein
LTDLIERALAGEMTPRAFKTVHSIGLSVAAAHARFGA